MVKLNGREQSVQVVEASKILIDAIQPWYEANRSAKGTVDSNVMCAGLYITEFLAGAFPLKPQIYAAESQVRGASGAKAKAILADHGETRKFTSEGGRTSRFTIRHAEKMADTVNSVGAAAGVGTLNSEDLHNLAWLLQEWFVARVRDDFFAKKKKISAIIDPQWSVCAVVEELIAAGRERGGNAAGAIVQHLVGAKLKIRFPEQGINVESYTTADLQTNRAGDYQIGTTAIHVTMAPGIKVFEERCVENLRQGFRPRVLVPKDQIDRAHVHAEDAKILNKVAIQSIEDFVGTNIEEVAGFEQENVRIELRRLLELYNSRIEQAESDLSLKIEIPENL
ncbi:DUF4928 family protein [Nocardia sp. NBC_01327]|uniref:DUF4928 family protein n=1 Tax=Nocardia sp. NBC_01327 TaxID=2903593 RepID=UPI002E12C0BD|nr:DUF4928 family protein [Nocardia sp. NBC_01327]